MEPTKGNQNTFMVKGIPLDHELLKIPQGFSLVNPINNFLDNEGMFVLGPTSRCYLDPNTALVWKSIAYSKTKYDKPLKVTFKVAATIYMLKKLVY